MADQLIVENFNEQTSYLVTDLEPEETYEFYVTALYSSGESSASNIAEITLTANENESVPTTFSLHGNYPNPFNPSTTIYFQIGKTENVNLEIFNTKGQKIKSYHVSKGQQQITWNGCDSNGKLVDSGIYFYRLSAQNKNIIRKMLLLK